MPAAKTPAEKKRFSKALAGKSIGSCGSGTILEIPSDQQEPAQRWIGERLEAQGLHSPQFGARAFWGAVTHLERTMRAIVRRQFTLVDAMVLVAAVGVSLVEVRRILRDDWYLSYGSWSWEHARALSYPLNEAVAVIALGLSYALCILRLRQPRPSLRRIIRQPGTAACASVVFYGSHILSHLGDFESSACFPARKVTSKINAAEGVQL